MVLMKVDYDICILQLKEMINTTMNTNRSGTWRNSNSTCAIAIMNTGIFPLSRFLTAKMFPESTKKSLQSWSTSFGYGIRKFKKRMHRNAPETLRLCQIMRNKPTRNKPRERGHKTYTGIYVYTRSYANPYLRAA